VVRGTLAGQARPARFTGSRCSSPTPPATCAWLPT